MQLVTSPRSQPPRNLLGVLRSYPAPQWAFTLGLTLGASLLMLLLATA